MVAFPVDPERYSERRIRRTVTTPARGGFVTARQTNTAVSALSSQAERRVYTLSWEYASQADWASIQTVYDSTFGGAVPVDFTPPQAGASVSCRIRSFTSESNHPAGAVRITVVLEEVL
jgi:hypothetical protein